MNFLFLLFVTFAHTQKDEKDTTIQRLQVYEEFNMPQDFNRQYRIALRRVRRVYPLVLEAARIIDSLDQELESIEKNRKKKKLMRKTHKALKDDFKYLLKDLYISEGKVLTKLIHRETGMTVAEIIKKYKNGFQSSLYTGLAGFFDQELDVKYKPNTDDFVLECVVQDILQGNVDFDPDFEKIDKEQHKINQKEYRAQKKKTRKRLRKQKREKRKEKREKRKSQK
ncbi:DUF4294 domain-containing protein [Brumimicrobium salinarum]|nr:DUF4294 domain-containing protein [Brumimicrobium salinarum]